MKKLLISLLLLVSVSAQADPYFEQRDKQLHMAGSALGASLFAMMGESPKEAFRDMMIIGILKEIADGNGNTLNEHAGDLVADALGSSVVFTFHYDF